MEKSLSEYISLSKNIDDLKFDKKLKVAILSSFTLNGLSEILHVKSSELGIRYQSYLGGYNQYNQELLDSQSEYYKFSPDVTFLILDIRNFLGKNFHFPYSISFGYYLCTPDGSSPLIIEGKEIQVTEGRLIIFGGHQSHEVPDSDISGRCMIAGNIAYTGAIE